jgi:hypothetical protein
MTKLVVAFAAALYLGASLGWFLAQILVPLQL